MHEVKAFVAFLASLNILSLQKEEVLLRDGAKMCSEVLAEKSGQSISLVMKVLQVLSILTTPYNPRMKLAAEKLGMTDFFTAEMSDFQEDLITFTLYGYKGSVYTTEVALHELYQMVALGERT